MFKDLLTFIFSLLFLIVLFIFSILTATSKFLTTKNITKIVKNTNYTELYKDKDGNDTEMISGFKRVLTKSGLKEDTADKVVNSEPTKEFIGTFIGNSIENMIKGKEEKVLTDEDVVDLVNSNIDLIEKEEEITLDKKTKQQILDTVKDNSYMLTQSMPSSKEIISKTGNDKLNDLIFMVNVLFSSKTKNIFIITLSVLAFLIFLLRYKYLRFLKSLGIPVIINGILLIIISYFLKDTLTTFILNSSSLFKVVFKPIISSLFNLLFKYGIISFFVGLVSTITYKFMKVTMGK